MSGTEESMSSNKGSGCDVVNSRRCGISYWRSMSYSKGSSMGKSKWGSMGYCKRSSMGYSDWGNRGGVG